METVEFLGILFRSRSHTNWFIFTIVLCIFSFAFFVIGARAKLYILPATIWGLLGALFFGISIGAGIRTKWGQINGPMWSGECVWYNGALAGIYFCGALLCSFFNRRLKIRGGGR